MTIFISYSHADKDMAKKIANQLIENNAHVWIDEYELNVGDSLITRVKDSIMNASAMLVLLSKFSVNSSWCNKELNSGIFRELDNENKIFVLPILIGNIDNGDIPVFLREKMYADFRGDFDEGMDKLIPAIAKFNNLNQKTFYRGNETYDWAVDWGIDDSLFFMRHTLIHSKEDVNFKILTEIKIDCNLYETKTAKKYEEKGKTQQYIALSLMALYLQFKDTQSKILIDDQMPRYFKLKINDNNSDRKWKIVMSSRRVGEDNGMDQIVDLNNYVELILDHIKDVKN